MKNHHKKVLASFLNAVSIVGMILLFLLTHWVKNADSSVFMALWFFLMPLLGLGFGAFSLISICSTVGSAGISSWGLYHSFPKDRMSVCIYVANILATATICTTFYYWYSRIALPTINSWNL